MLRVRNLPVLSLGKDQTHKLAHCPLIHQLCDTETAETLVRANGAPGRPADVYLNPRYNGRVESHSATRPSPLCRQQCLRSPSNSWFSKLTAFKANQQFCFCRGNFRLPGPAVCDRTVQRWHGGRLWLRGRRRGKVKGAVQSQPDRETPPWAN